MTAATPTADRDDPFSSILPALAAGGRALRDPAAYLAAAMVVGMTVLPASLLWLLAANQFAAPFATGRAFDDMVVGGDPFREPVLFDQMARNAGTAALATFVAVVLLVLGYVWVWMAVSVRAASVERGTPLAAWACVTTGVKRLFVAIGAWLLLALAAIPLAILYLLSLLTARIVVLSFVSVLLTAVLVVAVFAWLLALFLVSWTIAAFAAGDHRANVTTVLRRAVGLALSNPAAVVLLLIATSLVATLTVYVLAFPAFVSVGAGGSIVGAMAVEDRTISAALLGTLLALFVAALVLVPLSFSASTLAGFAVQVEHDLERIEASGRDIRGSLTGRLRRRGTDAADAPPATTTGWAPPPQAGQTPPPAPGATPPPTPGGDPGQQPTQPTPRPDDPSSWAPPTPGSPGDRPASGDPDPDDPDGPQRS